MKFVKCLVCGKKIKTHSWDVSKLALVKGLYLISCDKDLLFSRSYGRVIICPCGGATCLCKDYQRVKKLLQKIKREKLKNGYSIE